MENQTFKYTYSKNQSDEILKIRDKYIDKKVELTPYEKIQQLDRSTMRAGNTAALIVGVLSALVLGVGMCFVMVWNMLILGIIIGIVGICGAALTFPVYNAAIKRAKEKVKPEILRLCDEELKIN